MGVLKDVAFVSVGVDFLHLTAAEVGMERCGFVVELFEHGWLNPVVAIYEGDVFACCVGDSEVACHSGSHVVFGFEETELIFARMVLDHLLYKLDTVVGTMVVDKQELHFLQGLGQDHHVSHSRDTGMAA